MVQAGESSVCRSEQATSASGGEVKVEWAGVGVQCSAVQHGRTNEQANERWIAGAMFLGT